MNVLLRQYDNWTFMQNQVQFSTAQHGRQQLHIGNDLFRSLHQTPLEIPKEGGSSSKGWILQWTSSGLIQQI